MTTIELSIPPGRSALGMIARTTYQKPLQSGDAIRDDGWVYRDGQAAFKWFDQITPECSDRGLRVWPPALENITRIECAYWRAQRMLQENWQKNWPAFIEEFQQKKVAVFLAPENHPDYNPGDYFLYEFAQYHPKDDPSIRERGWRNPSQDGPPPAEADAELGLRYRNFIWVRHRQLGIRVGLLKTVLERAFERVLPKIAWPESPDEVASFKRREALKLGRMFRIQINGRFYWYQYTVDRWRSFRWVPHYWPDQELETINLDGQPGDNL